MDCGRKFMGEVIDLLRNNGIVRRPITTRNPQANAMVERVHQTIHNMIRTQKLRSKHDLPDGWIGVLTAVALSMRATIHTTNRASPTQLVFGRDHFLNVNFEANWQYIKHRKQRMIVQNNKRENAKRAPHQYNIGDKVLVLADPNRKHGEDEYLPAPHTVTHVYGNNTLRLRHETPSSGAKYQTWNLRQVKPYKD
jgi:NADH:ubiquinone oxidoreductase subunit